MTDTTTGHEGLWDTWARWDTMGQTSASEEGAVAASEAVIWVQEVQGAQAVMEARGVQAGLASTECLHQGPFTPEGLHHVSTKEALLHLTTIGGLMEWAGLLAWTGLWEGRKGQGGLWVLWAL